MKKHNRHQDLIAYIPSIIMLIVIFIFSSQNGSTSGHLSAVIYDCLHRLIPLPVSREFAIILIRKGAHMCEFALLTLSLDYGLYKNGHEHIMAKALILCFLFAALDEWHQSFVSGRAGLMTDVLIDTCGGIIVQLIGYMKTLT